MSEPVRSVAVLADVHSNAIALDAVLAEIGRERPYQAPGGAFWLALGPGVELRRTDYERERAAEHLRGIDGYWYAEKHAEVLLAPPSLEEFLERARSAYT